MTMPVHTSVTLLESAKTMLCALTGQFAHQTFLKFKHVYDNFGQRVQRIIMTSRTPQLFDAVLQEILMLIPQHQITSIPSMRNRLLLTVDTLVTDEGIRNVIFTAIKLIQVTFKRNCISSFENLHVFHVLLREYSVVIFATVPQQRYWC